MRDFDRINEVLPDELILEIFRQVESKPTRDACSLVCKRWLSLERLSRDTIRIGASDSSGNLIKLLSSRFPNIRSVFIDERISVSLPLPVQCGSRKRRRVSCASTSSGRFGHGSDQSVSEYDGTSASCLSDTELAAVGDSFTKLEKLSLIWCCSARDVGLRSLAEKCQSLRCLDLQRRSEKLAIEVGSLAGKLDNVASIGLGARKGNPTKDGSRSPVGSDHQPCAAVSLARGSRLLGGETALSFTSDRMAAVNRVAVPGFDAANLEG
ncbi:hypothetical protein OROMI_005836 [Orobanche minor]